jgi:hypothetical protein
MPSAFLIGFIEQGKNEINGIHGGFSQGIRACRNAARIALSPRFCQTNLEMWRLTGTHALSVCGFLTLIEVAIRGFQQF